MTQLPGAARAQLAVLSLAMVLGMAPWFAATVVAGGMSRDLGLTGSQQSWLTLAVQLGFVLGSVTSAVLLLSDRFSARRLAALSAALAGILTAALMTPTRGPAGAIVLRLLTGAALAGVYPPGIKMAAGWTTSHRGTAIGIVIGALTLGTATPHLLRLVADLTLWRPVIWGASGSALASAIVFWRFARNGPYDSRSVPFNPHALGRVLKDRGVLLATAGYLGHMWELFAMWSTLGVFMAEVIRMHRHSAALAPFLAFTVIGVGGAIGCVVAGVWADRIGKSRVTIVAMALSGTCALVVGPVSTSSFVLFVIVVFVWGVAIVADSAQFSACVAQLAPTGYIGTAVTAQTALGFLLTMLTIRLVPAWADAWGWRWAYAPLAAGPVLGIAAMWQLWQSRRI